jgi:hypothetical protein
VLFVILRGHCIRRFQDKPRMARISRIWEQRRMKPPTFTDPVLRN